MTAKDMKTFIAVSIAAHALVLMAAFLRLPGLYGYSGVNGHMQIVSLVEGGAAKYFNSKAKLKTPATVKLRKEADAAASVKADEKRASAEAAVTENEANAGVDVEAAGQGNEPLEGLVKSSGNSGYVASFKDMVRGRIEAAKFYPLSARERGYEGVVGVRFSIAADGSVKDVSVTRPCYCDALNKAAAEAVRKAGPYSAPPEMVTMEVDLSYRLE